MKAIAGMLLAIFVLAPGVYAACSLYTIETNGYSVKHHYPVIYGLDYDASAPMEFACNWETAKDEWRGCAALQIANIADFINPPPHRNPIWKFSGSILPTILGIHIPMSKGLGALDVPGIL